LVALFLLPVCKLLNLDALHALKFVNSVRTVPWRIVEMDLCTRSTNKTSSEISLLLHSEHIAGAIPDDFHNLHSSTKPGHDTRLTDNKLCIAPTPLLELTNLKQMISNPVEVTLTVACRHMNDLKMDRLLDNNLCKALGVTQNTLKR
jgi:hypothetical protein